MATIFLLLVLIAAYALSMRRAAMWTYAALALGTWWVWSSGLFDGDGFWPSLDVISVLALLPVLALCALAIPSLRRTWIVAPAYSMVR